MMSMYSTYEGTKAPAKNAATEEKGVQNDHLLKAGVGIKDRRLERPTKKLASVEGIAQIWKSLGTPGKGAAIGLAAMLPFIPGMIGSRKKGDELRDIYSGVEPVPIHAGRWWEVGSTAFEGSRIKEWRPHWSILHKSHAEDAALYGSEAEKCKHNPLLHP